MLCDRAAIHWDDADLPKEVVMRPASRAANQWHWSGSFRLSTRRSFSPKQQPRPVNEIGIKEHFGTMCLCFTAKFASCQPAPT